jgi:serine protease inhibitor
VKKLLIIVVSLLIVVTGCGTGNKHESLNAETISSNNQLGFDLLPNAASKDSNIFISPTSLLMALSMVYNGAEGVTKEEMAKVLHAEGIEVNQLNQANASLMTMLQNDTKHGQLNIANSIWLNNHFHFRDDFSQNSRDYYQAKIQGMDPTNPKTAKVINGWVKNKTNGKINKIINASDLDPNTVAFLINAIYFKGKWEHPFDKNLTEKRIFHLADGALKNMPFMTLSRKIPYIENEDFQAVILPYADGKMSMTVFLPKNLEEFRKVLTNDNWEKWNTKFQEKDGTILLPKFKLEYEAEWSEVLKKLGMTTAFNEGAHFNKMIKESDPIWISQVKQKTFLNVNEEGSEAAAATSVKMKTKSAPTTDPFHMEANHPFFMAITNNETGIIVFMGFVLNPEKGN